MFQELAKRVPVRPARAVLMVRRTEARMDSTRRRRKRRSKRSGEESEVKGDEYRFGHGWVIVGVVRGAPPADAVAQVTARAAASALGSLHVL